MITIALVSCVKSKRPNATKAKDLYTSPLFKGLRRYAEAHADHFYILSAKYGLVHPEDVIKPYEKTLNNMPIGERQAWAADVLAALEKELPKKCRIMFLAGAKYREILVKELKAKGYKIKIPFKGVRMGEQLKALSQLKEKPKGFGIV